MADTENKLTAGQYLVINRFLDDKGLDEDAKNAAREFMREAMAASQNFNVDALNAAFDEYQQQVATALFQGEQQFGPPAQAQGEPNISNEPEGNIKDAITTMAKGVIRDSLERLNLELAQEQKQELTTLLVDAMAESPEITDADNLMTAIEEFLTDEQVLGAAELIRDEERNHSAPAQAPVFGGEMDAPQPGNVSTLPVAPAAPSATREELLEQQVRELEAENAALEQENSGLRASLEQQQQAIDALQNKLNDLAEQIQASQQATPAEPTPVVPAPAEPTPPAPTQSQDEIKAAILEFAGSLLNGDSADDRGALQALRDTLGISGDIGYTNAGATAKQGGHDFVTTRTSVNLLKTMDGMLQDGSLSPEELDRLKEVVGGTALTKDTTAFDDVPAPEMSKEQREALRDRIAGEGRS